MPVSILSSCSLVGMSAPPVKVEVDISPGLPAFSIVGMPDTSIKESRIRIRSAIINSGFHFPAGHITANLSPADLPKESSRFDLALALGILIASGQIQVNESLSLEQVLFVGELSLTGQVMPVKSPLIIALSHYQRYPQQGKLVLPRANLAEASLVKHLPLIGVSHLNDIILQLNTAWQISEVPITPNQPQTQGSCLCLSDIRGQTMAVRALEICASGGHGLLMSGSPGVGKSMLASRLPSILPDLSEKALLEVIALHSLKSSQYELSHRPPFRSPHHSTSAIALVGGGSSIKPGEISLAHHGVLFLDELPEFNRFVLETLREPMEKGEIHIARARMEVTYPARFQLIAAMNPCPCGYLGHHQKLCRCRPDQIQRYQQKISGPFLDRIDMQINLFPPKDNWYDAPFAEPSVTVRQRVSECRDRQLHRQSCLNAQLPEKHEALHLDEKSTMLLNQASKHFNWSMRVIHRLLRVARSISDMAQQDHIQAQHISEAISYRVGIHTQQS